MTQQRKQILAISGSTRKGSSNDRILHMFQRNYQDHVDIAIYDHIDRLPHFNPDSETPDSVLHFLEAIEAADGILICTPEYVFSLPGVLKNALEWTVSTVVFSDKPTAFIVASSLGEKAFESLDLILNTLGAKMEESSKLLIQGIQSKLVQDQWKDTITQCEVEQFIHSFVSTLSVPPTKHHNLSS